MQKQELNVSKVGIDSISFFTSNMYIDLASLAKERNIDSDKYYKGLGQHQMATPAVDEDVVTLAANAAINIVNDDNKHEITNVLFATESGVDQSKAAGIFVHQLLDLPKNCRVVELKQACYSSTAALQLGLAELSRNPKQKILVLASDIARYGLNTPGEPSQGCGAVAFILSANPRILEIDPESGYFTQDIMDFWRPNYRDEALVEGKYSSKMYLQSLQACWEHLSTKTDRTFNDYYRFCYHTPVCRLAEKAHKFLGKLNGERLDDSQIKQHVQAGLNYNRTVGNCYTAALYLSLCSLIDNSKEDLTNKRIGLYAYGSGSVAEYFSGKLVEGYQAHSPKTQHTQMLNNRVELTYEQYKSLYSHQLPQDGSDLDLPKQQKGTFRLAGLRRHIRVYEKA
jgi:hydroxymethylglutaryl-CoA synthase